MNGEGDFGGSVQNSKQESFTENAVEEEVLTKEAEPNEALISVNDKPESHHDVFDGQKYEDDFEEGDPLDCCTCVTWARCCHCIPEPNRTRLKFSLIFFVNLAVYLLSTSFIYVDIGLDIYYMVTFLHRRGYMIALGLSAAFMMLSMLVAAIVNNQIRFGSEEEATESQSSNRMTKVKKNCKRLCYLLLDFPLPQLYIGYTLLKQTSHKMKLFCMALSCCKKREQVEENLEEIKKWNREASRGLSARIPTAVSLVVSTDREAHKNCDGDTGGSGSDSLPITENEVEENVETDRLMGGEIPLDDLDTGKAKHDGGHASEVTGKDYTSTGAGRDESDEEDEEITYIDEAAGFFKSPYIPPKMKEDIPDGVDHAGFFVNVPGKSIPKDLDIIENIVQDEGIDVPNTQREINLVEMSITSDFYVARIKLLESLLEAAPQLLINLFIMMRYHDNVETIQIVVAVVSFLSFVWGIVQFERLAKTNGCFEHTQRYRAPNRMEISQTVLVFLYKALLLGARFLSLVYFASTFTFVILAVVLTHFFLSVIWLTYNRVHFGVFKLMDETVSVQEKWQHFLMIIINSVLNIFLYFHDMYPTWESPSLLLSADMVIYYLFFTVETIMLLLFPMARNKHNTDKHYYFIMSACLLGLFLGLGLMFLYYFCVHKSKKVMRHRYLGFCNRNKDKNVPMPYRDYHTKNIKMIEKRDVDKGKKIEMGEMYKETYLGCRKKGVCIVSTPGGIYKMVPLEAVKRKIHKETTKVAQNSEGEAETQI
ncbi:uncharacterized protein LOC106178499 [Lingula anatina]|uniref:XK-related protein n=1 Tax=Lingula anatina TaxID=7574 RepID=A0A1S3K3F0_LINAN|nr:uncharacterized protein LOC106178499 [Lingula anatina]XP_013417159.1 uncharacterized protein LOC106178499 [Lingula anatina]|eukprot:XP_013417158.1 uncharacterized protein LOC106178499 [Lingula anatina]